MPNPQGDMRTVGGKGLESNRSIPADNGLDNRHRKSEENGKRFNHYRSNGMTGLIGRWCYRRRQASPTSDHYRSRHRFQGISKIKNRTLGREPYRKISITFMWTTKQAGRIKAQRMENRNESKQGMSDTILIHSNRLSVQNT